MRINADQAGVPKKRDHVALTIPSLNDLAIHRRPSSLPLNSSVFIPQDKFAKEALQLRELFQAIAKHSGLQNIAYSWL